MNTVLRWFVRLWVGLVVLVNLAAIAGLMLAADSFLAGLGRVREIYSPFNVVNWIVEIVLLSPAILAYVWLSRREAAQAARMQPVSLYRLKAQYRGTRVADLIERHLRRQDTDGLWSGARGTCELLPEPVRPMVEEFIDRWSSSAYDASFWSRDTADVLTEITEDARRLLGARGIQADDEMLFTFFQVVILSYAYSASDQPKMREFMGLSR